MICFTVIEYNFQIVSNGITVYHSCQNEEHIQRCDCTPNTSTATISSVVSINISAPDITNTSTAIRTNKSAVNSSNEAVILKTEKDLRNYFVQTPYIFDKFTIVTPTYKRTDNLYRLFDTYCPITDVIHKILILWNNVGESIPEKVIEYAKKCTIPVIFKIMERNNLTSRFIPFPDIETAGMYIYRYGQEPIMTLTRKCKSRSDKRPHI